jgi:hypothetical protein
VQGSLDIRVKGLRLPQDYRHDQLVERHWPRNILLVVAGKTFRYLDWFVDHTEEVEPQLQYSTLSQAVKVRSGPLLQPGIYPGVLTFRTDDGAFRISVTVRIVRSA